MQWSKWYKLIHWRNAQQRGTLDGMAPKGLSERIVFSLELIGHACLHVNLFQSRLTLCNPMDCSPPGSSVHGILQARILAWVVMPSFRGSSWPRDQSSISYVSCIGRKIAPPGKPLELILSSQIYDWELPMQRSKSERNFDAKNRMRSDT